MRGSQRASPTSSPTSSTPSTKVGTCVWGSFSITVNTSSKNSSPSVLMPNILPSCVAIRTSEAPFR